MPVTQLTAGFTQRATCPPGRKKIEYRDTTIIGFCLEVRESGGATYYQRYFDKSGRQRQFKIGGVNDITFDQARKKAKALRADTVLGGDPMSRKEAQRSVPTFSELAKQHLEEARRVQRSWWSTESALRLHIVPRWSKYRLDEIRGQEVAVWLGDMRAKGLKPATVDRIRAVMHRSFELARRWGMPGASPNPLHGIVQPRYDNRRTRSLNQDEIRRLKWACELSSNGQLKNIVGILLATGVRKSELLHAEWKHVDLERRLWFIPHTKSGRSRHVPLSQLAVDIINQLPRMKGCPYLVPNLRTGKPFVSIKKAFSAARKEADLQDVRLHDLRHAFASGLVNAGVSLYCVSKLLGHADGSTAVTARYAHLESDALLAAVNLGSAKLNVGWVEPTT